MDYGEYNDAYFCPHILHERCIPFHNTPSSKYIINENNDITKFIELTRENNKNSTNILSTDFMRMKNDIRNYRELSKQQIDNIEKLDENQKIEIIKLYNTMFSIVIDILK
jgi:hypothetical protein